VALQEVWAAGEENLAGWLADRLGMQWTWSASPAPERWQQRTGDPTTQFGNAILSRFPTTDHAMEVLPLPTTARTRARTPSCTRESRRRQASYRSSPHS
jgi:endonuclease/exonuclease/phosphatase family metal-dependent hydrolase